MSATRRPDYAAGPVGLIAAILEDLPSLPGAACRGRHELFDPAQPDEDRTELGYRHRAAARICTRCRVLNQCNGQHRGMVAGGHVPSPPNTKGRPRRNEAA